jgi:acid stress-induced BolA-like protein IbaG/YrbA
MMFEVLLQEERLREILNGVEGATEIVVWREGIKLLGIVVSPAFEDKPVHVRQSEVWRLLLDALSDDEHAQVAFVYTNTPEEKAEAEREAASRG